MAEVRPFAFVLMPFDGQFDDLYQLGIKHAALQHGIVAERVDEQNFSETILERIYRQIDQCDFVIAEMTGRNPNVFYEVGYAHAKRKSCLLLTQSADHIPFDLKHHPHIIYDGSISDLRQKIEPKIDWIKQEILSQKSKIISLKIENAFGTLDKSEEIHFGRLELPIRMRNNTDRRSPEIEALYITASDSWEVWQNGERCAYEVTETAKGKLHRFQINPSMRRLSPNMFAEIRTKWARVLWSQFDDAFGEPREEYTVSGELRFELVTSEGILTETKFLEVDFDDIPF